MASVRGKGQNAMELAVQIGNVADGSLGGTIQYCRDLEVKRLIVPFNAVPGFAEDGYLGSDNLWSVKNQIEDAGMGCSVMVTTVRGQPQLSDMIMGGLEGETQFANLSRSMECMSDAGMDTLLMFLTLEKPQDPKEESARWDRLVGLYRKLTTEAENCGVKIATHTVSRADRYILWDYKGLQRLFQEVPSPSNGVCFCIGNFWLSEGAEIYDVIRSLGERLLFVHLRSTRQGLGETPFWFDAGGPDYSRILQALKDIDYRGDMRAEHMPEVAGENRSDIGTAWAIGYMKALMQFL